MTLIRWADFPNLGDDRGSLVAVEASMIIPFDIKRVYYLYNTKSDVTRGLHAHKALKQVMICIVGSCQVTLDDGRSRETALLNSPYRGLLVEGMLWREMYDFSRDCVLLVAASELYDEGDYVRDYQSFLSMTSNA